jgi:hypothetical protein
LDVAQKDADFLIPITALIVRQALADESGAVGDYPQQVLGIQAGLGPLLNRSFCSNNVNTECVAFVSSTV